MRPQRAAVAAMRQESAVLPTPPLPDATQRTGQGFGPCAMLESMCGSSWSIRLRSGLDGLEAPRGAAAAGMLSTSSRSSASGAAAEEAPFSALCLRSCRADALLLAPSASSGPASASADCSRSRRSGRRRSIDSGKAVPGTIQHGGRYRGKVGSACSSSASGDDPDGRRGTWKNRLKT